MAERSFRGFRYTEQRTAGTFGDVYGGVGPSGAVRILEVAEDLAALAGFAETLERIARGVAALRHHNVESTIDLGRNSDGRLVIVTASPRDAVSLSALIQDSESADITFPEDVALAIAHPVIEALAHAHAVEVVHGGVHPCSVLVDGDGRVMLADFAVARAAAAASSATGLPYRGMRGYIAPELALGDEPTPATDVFAAGVLLHELLTGELPQMPVPRLANRPDLAALVRRSIHTDETQRITDGAHLRGAFVRSITEAQVRRATPDLVSSFVDALRSAADASFDDGLDLHTENVLAELEQELDGDPTGDFGGGFAAADVDDELSIDDGALTAVAATPGALASAAPAGGGPLRDTVEARALGAGLDDSLLDAEMDDLVAGLDTRVDTLADSAPPAIAQHEDELTHTDVDGTLGARAVDDVIDELIATGEPTGQINLGDSDDTPLPQPVPHHEVDRSELLSGPELLARSHAPERTLGSTREREPAPAAAPAAKPAPRPAVAAAALGPDLTLDHTDLAPRKRSGAGLWFATTLIALGALGVVVYTKTDIFHPERARQKQAERRAEHEAAQRRLDEARIRAGSVAIDSTPDEAAVWVSLGRTPCASLPVPAAMVHQVRFEHEGYVTKDVNVMPAQWTGTAAEPTATVAIELTPGQNDPTPAAPAPPPESLSQRPGVGLIRIESTPQGAHVWLLVGFTPEFELAGIPAGLEYEFKVVKDGYSPAFVLIRDGDWRADGGAFRERLTREVELAELPRKRRR